MGMLKFGVEQSLDSLMTYIRELISRLWCPHRSVYDKPSLSSFVPTFFKGASAAPSLPFIHLGNLIDAKSLAMSINKSLMQASGGHTHRQRSRHGTCCPTAHSSVSPPVLRHLREPRRARRGLPLPPADRLRPGGGGGRRRGGRGADPPAEPRQEGFPSSQLAVLLP